MQKSLGELLREVLSGDIKLSDDKNLFWAFIAVRENINYNMLKRIHRTVATDHYIHMWS